MSNIKIILLIGIKLFNKLREKFPRREYRSRNLKSIPFQAIQGEVRNKILRATPKKNIYNFVKRNQLISIKINLNRVMYHLIRNQRKKL